MIERMQQTVAELGTKIETESRNIIKRVISANTAEMKGSLAGIEVQLKEISRQVVDFSRHDRSKKTIAGSKESPHWLFKSRSGSRHASAAFVPHNHRDVPPEGSSSNGSMHPVSLPDPAVTMSR